MITQEKLDFMVEVAQEANTAHAKEEQLCHLFEREDNVIFCITGVYGSIRYANEAFTKILGWPPNKIRTMSWMSLMNRDDLEQAALVLGQMQYPFLNPQPLTFDIRVQKSPAMGSGYIKMKLYVVGWTNTGWSYTAGEEV